jgi:hypothetical protein
MKYVIILLCFVSSVAFAGERCSESTNEQLENVVYEVNTQIPSHLKGATIVIKQADGRESSCPAEKCMVVPRIQKTVLGQNRTVSKSVKCTKDGNKNLLIGELRKDVTELETDSSAVPNGQQARVSARKELVPGINYFRREVIGLVGGGIGIDTNGTPKALLGVEF